MVGVPRILVKAAKQAMIFAKGDMKIGNRFSRARSRANDLPRFLMVFLTHWLGRQEGMD